MKFKRFVRCPYMCVVFFLFLFLIYYTPWQPWRTTPPGSGAPTIFPQPAGKSIRCQLPCIRKHNQNTRENAKGEGEWGGASVFRVGVYRWGGRRGRKARCQPKQPQYADDCKPINWQYAIDFIDNICLKCHH